MKLLLLTDRRLTGGRPLVDVVRAAVDGGADTVVLREKDHPRHERAALAQQLRALVPTLFVASDPSIDADGVHLAAADQPCAGRARQTATVGRSCHSAAELAAAAAEGCDYATLSPIFPSSSKPGYGPALGVDALRDLPLPVFALGGITPENARACVEAGAAGVAVMSYVMGADDPAVAVKELLS
jgi:thiamine-phosphate diphosphorylase